MIATKLVVIGAAAALGAVGTGIAVASGVTLPFSGDGNTISGCYSSGGALKVLTPTQSSCPDGFTPIQWNVTGPQGPQGPAGPVGATGPQGPAGPSGLSGWTVRTVTFTLADGDGEETTVPCHVGESVLGGGVTANPALALDIGESGPVANQFGSGWAVVVANASGYTLDVTVSAICAFTS